MAALCWLCPPGSGPERFACVGGEIPGQLAPFTVTLVVNSSGAVQRQSATWFLSNGDLAHGPGLIFDYGMMGRDVIPTPIGLSVVALVKLSPRPKAKAADIVLLLGGAEKARRAWQLYAKAISAPVDPTKTPAAFVGGVPFYPGGVDDVGLKAILAAVGHPGAAVEARIVGDDGGILADGTMQVDRPPARDAPTVSALLDQALALAKTPTRCHKLAN
ncbi:MAG TPA: hypothetical protein VIB82_00510 [Caulobacteraceae bacterium]